MSGSPQFYPPGFYNRISPLGYPTPMYGATPFFFPFRPSAMPQPATGKKILEEPTAPIVLQFFNEILESPKTKKRALSISPASELGFHQLAEYIRNSPTSLHYTDGNSRSSSSASVGSYGHHLGGGETTLT